jgi:hypothetical protein
MSKIRISASVALTLLLLVGCVPLPVVGWTPVFLAGSTDFDLPDYSLGPVSSDQFPGLVKTAIPADRGEAILFGRVDMAFRADNHVIDFSAVAVLSETDILLLKWHETEDRYDILARLEYSEIQSVEMTTWGVGRHIWLCLAKTEFVLAGQRHAVQPLVSMVFIKPSGLLQDGDRSETAFALLHEKIDPNEGACDSPYERTDRNIGTGSQGFSE